jgi:hypothetical protein
MTAVGTLLRQHGLRIDEASFARLVEEALADIGPAGVDDPAGALSEGDAEALRAVGADLSPRRRREGDPRSSGAAAAVAVLADALTVSQVAERLGIDPSRVRHRLADGGLVGIKRGRGWLVPAWQFGPDGAPLPGLTAVAPSLAQLHPVVAASFAATPQPELTGPGGRPQSPREWLAGAGDPRPVAALARDLVEQL